MEMLIVVAIIAVLVAVAIPTFSSQLHKARVATDWANVRSYYAQLQYEFMETGEINESYLHGVGMAPTGLTSFQLSGQDITLKAGSIWVGQMIRKARPDTILLMPALCTHIIRIVN